MTSAPRRRPRSAAFDDPRVRAAAVATLLAAAILSPNVGLPGGLPAVRFEQIVLVAFLLPLAGYLRRHPEARGWGIVDVAFAALVVAVGISLALAPYPARDPRDLFEIARPVEYWLCYRMAATLSSERRTGTIVVATVLGVGAIAALIALSQYPRVPFIGGALAFVWATGHNLDGVIRSGRVAGTAGNANVFGSLIGGLALVGFWTGAAGPARRWHLVGWVVLALCIGGLVLAQSRTAILATAAGLLLTLVLEVRHQSRGPLLATLAVTVAAVVLASVILVRYPPHNGSVAVRFDPSELGSDPSVVVRLARLQTFLAAPDPNLEHTLVCSTPVGFPAPGHAPTEAMASGDTGVVGADQRDALRKQDVNTIAQAIDAWFCRTGRWPIGSADALVPTVLPALPRDPLTGAGYRITLRADGYEIAAPLESRSDPDGPTYVVGTSPDLILNPSFEQGESSVEDWQADPGTMLTRGGPALFGDTAANITFGLQGYVVQYVVYRFPVRTPYVLHAWARSADGRAVQVEAYLAAFLTDGSRISPIAHADVGLGPGGGWQPVELRFTTPATPVWVLQVLLRPADGAPAGMTLDGISLTEGDLAPSFSTVRDVDPARLPTALLSWRSSPVIGIGPIDTLILGSFDDEYLLVTLRFGLLGLAAYLALYVVAGITAWRARAVAPPLSRGLAVAVLGYVVALVLFNAAAGSYFNYQLMAVTWLLVGASAAARGIDGHTLGPTASTDWTAG